MAEGRHQPEFRERLRVAMAQADKNPGNLARAFIQSVPVELGHSRHGVRRPFRVLAPVWQPWAEED